MAVLNLDEVLELKADLKERFGVHLHMHDVCGGQSFSIDLPELSEEVKQYLEEYFSRRGQSISISEYGYFSVK